MSHANAILTPRNWLRLARCVVDDGWPLRRAAKRSQVSVTTAARLGRPGVTVSRVKTGCRTFPAVPAVPRGARARAGNAGLSLAGSTADGVRPGSDTSTVHRVLSRYGLAKLSRLDRAMGAVIRRYEHHSPGRWSMWTSRNWAASLAAADTVWWESGRQQKQDRHAGQPASRLRLPAQRRR
jgi:hypothetical protein